MPEQSALPRSDSAGCGAVLLLEKPKFLLFFAGASGLIERLAYRRTQASFWLVTNICIFGAIVILGLARLQRSRQSPHPGEIVRRNPGGVERSHGYPGLHGSDQERTFSGDLQIGISIL